MKIHLQLINGAKIDQSIDKDSFIIGRSAKSDVVVPHEGMSRQHCQVELVNGEVYITDLGSTNGVLIDGNKIEPHKKTHYATYLTLAFGAVQSMQIEVAVDSTRSLHFQNVVPPKKDAPKELPASNATMMTKTKTLQEMARGTPTPAKEKGSVQKKEEKNYKSLMVNLLCLMILGGAVWWFMQSKGTSSEEPAEEPIDDNSAYTEP